MLTITSHMKHLYNILLRWHESKCLANSDGLSQIVVHPSPQSHANTAIGGVRWQILLNMSLLTSHMSLLKAKNHLNLMRLHHLHSSPWQIVLAQN